MHDAVDWKIIDENPFRKVKTHKSSVKVNEFVPREVVDKLMKKANPVWQVKSMRVGVFLIILHSQFSILNLLVTEDDFAKAAGVEKVVLER